MHRDVPVLKSFQHTVEPCCDEVDESTCTYYFSKN